MDAELYFFPQAKTRQIVLWLMFPENKTKTGVLSMFCIFLKCSGLQYHLLKSWSTTQEARLSPGFCFNKRNYVVFINFYSEFIKNVSF